MSKLQNLVPPGVKPNQIIIQDLLRKGCALDDVAIKFELAVIPHPRFANLIWFGEDGGDVWSPAVRQCRGLILDSANKWNCVARPLDHIFEWSHACAPVIDWTTQPRVFDKIDGHMLYLYSYADQWFVGSRRHPDARVIPPHNTKPLNALFWAAFIDSGWQIPPASFSGCTFIWELRGPLLCPVVPFTVRESKNILTLVAVRNNQTGEEMDPSIFSDQGIRPYCTAWEEGASFKEMKEILQTVVDTTLTWSEGYMVVDKHWNRVVVTHPQYNEHRRFRDTLTLEWIVNSIRTKADISDLYRYAPDWLPMYTMVAKGYTDLMKRIYEATQLNLPAQSAEAVQEATVQYPWMEILLKRHSGELSSISGGLRNVPWETLLSWMEVPAAKEGKVA